MSTLIRDVLFPSAAAIGLLAAAAADLAVAQEVPSTDRAAAYQTPYKAVTAVRMPSIESAAARSGEAPMLPEQEPRRSVVEPRCERIERIGKFAMTRCD